MFRTLKYGFTLKLRFFSTKDKLIKNFKMQKNQKTK